MEASNSHAVRWPCNKQQQHKTGCWAEAADLMGELRRHAVLQLRWVDAGQGLLPQHSRRGAMYLRLLTAICRHLALKVTARVLQSKADGAGRAQRQSRGCQIAKTPGPIVPDAAPCIVMARLHIPEKCT